MRRSCPLPNLGDSASDDFLTDGLAPLTIWITHSYPACAPTRLPSICSSQPEQRRSS
jgi:hypothetical protein